MKAMILAAGRGERMRPLTDKLPKPLLKVHGKPLIEYHLERLSHNGFTEVIINIAHLGYKIPQTLGDGRRWNITITYSDEQDEGALESAGGIIKALPLLGDEFLVVNGDVWCDYEFDAHFKLKHYLAHLLLVPNPQHNSRGDFALEGERVLNDAEEKFTFSGIGYYRAELFKDLPYGKAALAPILRETIANRRVSGALYQKCWHDIGTPQRLKEINSINF
jgi:MurNAc alpha-1-phosphate uridylyltransferase